MEKVEQSEGQRKMRSLRASQGVGSAGMISTLYFIPSTTGSQRKVFGGNF